MASVLLDETLALADRCEVQINGKPRAWFEIDRPERYDGSEPADSCA